MPCSTSSGVGPLLDRLPSTVRIATRGSPLALWQARHVAALLREVGLTRTATVVVETSGDRRRDVPIDVIGGRGVFVAEVRQAVMDGAADIAVHSAKDLPSAPEAMPEGLVIAAVPARGEARDALVGSRLDDLSPGALVATGSARRRAQLAWLRPDLCFVELRGNIGTRLGKVPPGGAIVVAAAALERLGELERAAEVLPVSTMLPQVGQGALAVECRAGDEALREALALIEDAESRRRLEAERGFLARLGGGCDLPAGAHATCDPDGSLVLEGLLARIDGHVLLRRRMVAPAGSDPGRLGAALAEDLLVRCGGSTLVDIRP